MISFSDQIVSDSTTPTLSIYSNLDNIIILGKPGDRAMPTMASGMEAEEETEHHLQRAIATETVSPNHIGAIFIICILVIEWSSTYSNSYS